MKSADDHQEDIRLLHERWREGDFTAAMEAFALTAWRREAVPEWLTQPVLDALAFAFEHGGAKGRGRGGGFRVQSGLATKHKMRWDAAIFAQREGDRGMWERASALLLGTFAFGTPRQIKRSYDKIEATTNTPN